MPPQLPDPPPATPRPRGWAVGDFVIGGGRVALRKTGNSAAIDRRLLAEVGIWIGYHLTVRLVGAWRRLRQPGPQIWFTPDRPHPRYMIRAVATWAGLRIAACERDADIAIFFEDATQSAPVETRVARRFNFACTDISKSHVAAVFERVAGYPLAIDPTVWTGPAVEKSEANGTHDGRIVACPRPRVAGRCYQRLIDTIAADGCAVDLRTHCIGGEAVIVWEKRRTAAARFLPPNLTAVMRTPDAIFSAEERALIARFTAAMGADWCGLDILRDTDGRIYIVDVNKTDAGPVIALRFGDKLQSTAILARAFVAMIAAG